MYQASPNEVSESVSEHSCTSIGYHSIFLVVFASAISMGQLFKFSYFLQFCTLLGTSTRTVQVVYL